MSLQCGARTLALRLSTSNEHPVRIEAVGGDATTATPLVEVLVLGEGRSTNQTRNLVNTLRGAALRYAGHQADADGVVITQTSTDGALEAVTHVGTPGSSLTFRTTVTNTGSRDLVIQAVTAGVLPVPFSMPSTDILTGRSSWCAENRWRVESLEDAGLVDCATDRMHVLGSATVTRVGTSTWTTDGPLPVGALEDRSTGRGLAWQISGGGPWRWELDSAATTPGHFLLAAAGPTDLDHAWSATLAPGASFTTPELVASFSEQGGQGAIQARTRRRRSAAAAHPTSTGRTELVFNDYMNTIKADPTDEKLLPLIAAAADVGAEVFCIDAGWYDEDGDWWPSVGEWQPSRTRWGSIGLQGVLDAIRDHGMRPGLWLEPEVIGVRSPMADRLPEDAFIRRGGTRVVEHGRYFLNLTSADARAHLDETFDRLIDMGTRFFKLDYNVTPGLGDDALGSPGEGLRDHVSAYLAWFEALRERHPSVTIENCGSGAMRQDWDQVSRFDLQSTSDQQDYLLYPPIAVGAPMILLPEQAGNWAYAQPEMTQELIAFVHVTGLAGRPYYSGHLDRMADAQRALVREAADTWKAIREQTVDGLPFWPAGLPRWSDDVPALGLMCPDGGCYVAVWNRSDAPNAVDLTMPPGFEAGGVEQVYPRDLPGWEATADEARVSVTAPAGPSARLFRIIPR